MLSERSNQWRTSGDSAVTVRVNIPLIPLAELAGTREYFAPDFSW